MISNLHVTSIRKGARIREEGKPGEAVFWPIRGEGSISVTMVRDETLSVRNETPNSNENKEGPSCGGRIYFISCTHLKGRRTNGKRGRKERSIRDWERNLGWNEMGCQSGSKRGSRNRSRPKGRRARPVKPVEKESPKGGGP